MSKAQRYGYYVGYGYMGYVGNGYRLFATEEEYLDWCEEQ